MVVRTDGGKRWCDPPTAVCGDQALALQLHNTKFRLLEASSEQCGTSVLFCFLSPCSSSHTMTANGFSTTSDAGDAFLSYLIALLSIHELRPYPAPLPQYNGKTDWQTDSILRSLGAIVQRMYSAEEQLASIKASQIWRIESATDSRKRRMACDPHSSSSSDESTHGMESPLASDLSSFSSTTDVEPLHNGNVPTLAAERPSTTPMTISLDGLSNTLDSSKMFSKSHLKKNNFSTSAPPSSHNPFNSCPTCGKVIADAITMSIVTASMSLDGSPMVIPPGPLATAAFESGMSAVEELRLLKAQVQDVARVCNAVARGDLSQKITVPVQGVVMVQLKNVINTMVIFIALSLSRLRSRSSFVNQVDKLGQFAKEVTRVSQEVGTEG
jgi:osomolarity two-component system sensor histidine kinase NIK1